MDCQQKCAIVTVKIIMAFYSSSSLISTIAAFSIKQLAQRQNASEQSKQALSLLLYLLLGTNYASDIILGFFKGQPKGIKKAVVVGLIFNTLKFLCELAIIIAYTIFHATWTINLNLQYLIANGLIFLLSFCVFGHLGYIFILASLLKKAHFRNYNAFEILVAVTLISTKRVAVDVYNTHTHDKIGSISQVLINDNDYQQQQEKQKRQYQQELQKENKDIQLQYNEYKRFDENDNEDDKNKNRNINRNKRQIQNEKQDLKQDINIKLEIMRRALQNYKYRR